MNKIPCFKSYDIRGKLPEELNEDIAWCIGRATSEYLKAKSMVVGGDIRLSTPALKKALSDGLQSGGTDVIDIGLCGTEEIYFATSYFGVDGGVMVTASHNPRDYNGLKLVREKSKPISGDTGLREIQRLAEKFFDLPCGIGESSRQYRHFHHLRESSEDRAPLGRYELKSCLEPYVDHILGYIKPEELKPLKLVVNAGNGSAGHVIDAIEKKFNAAIMDGGSASMEGSNNKPACVPVEFVKIHHEPDGHFPNGIPNPLLPDCRQATIDATIKHKADMGIAWDGDFDRCFFFDEKGQFIEGYYIVALLGEAFLAHEPGAKIIHDPRLIWNTIDQVKEAGGVPVLCKTGHAFIKERMRAEDAVYGGEMSAHHYFRDFAYCDSGMIPWLLVIELMSRKGKPLSELVAERIARYPSSGEINSKLENPQATIDRILDIYKQDAVELDYTDGISVDMGEWRFNLRISNTEPVIRLNVESRGDEVLMQTKTAELLGWIRN